MIHVIATVHLAQDTREQFLMEFHKVLPAVHDEEGCVDYGPAVDLETSIGAQSDPRPNVVTVVEKWESLEALERHLIASHMVKYRERVKDLVQNVELQVLQPA